MTEKRNTCPLCENHLEPAKAEITNDLYKGILLTSEAYLTAFHASCASVENNKYRRLADKLDALTHRITETIENIHSLLSLAS